MAKSYLLIITHSTDDQDRANSAVALAVSLLSDGVDLALFFTFHGALLAKKGVAETVAGQEFHAGSGTLPDDPRGEDPALPLRSLRQDVRDRPDDLVPGVKIITLPTLATEMPSRETITL